MAYLVPVVEVIVGNSRLASCALAALCAWAGCSTSNCTYPTTTYVAHQQHVVGVELLHQGCHDLYPAVDRLARCATMRPGKPVGLLKTRNKCVFTYLSQSCTVVGSLISSHASSVGSSCCSVCYGERHKYIQHRNRTRYSRRLIALRRVTIFCSCG